MTTSPTGSVDRRRHIVQQEKDLFPIIKRSFKESGYRVFAEVACNYRGVDMVAVKGDEHIAIELKKSFNDHVVRQANWNTAFFDKSYIAYPVQKVTLFHSDDVYWKLRESIRDRYDWCKRWGIGILQVLPSVVIYEALEATCQTPRRKLDLQHYVEADDDIGGVPYQKGVSEGYYELESIKQYVAQHPNASWKEIFENVSNHYANPSSMAGSMSQWRGFRLGEFKESLKGAK